MAVLTWASVCAFAYGTLAAPSFLSSRGHYSTAPTAKVKNGTLQGVYSAEYDQDFFLGIPFAEPPTGENRFRAPQSIQTGWKGVRDASQYSAACVGYGSDDWPYPSLSEDCLYMNVIRPAGYENEKLPVGFWIHGGGLFEGSGIDQRYNLSFIVQRSVEIGKPFIGVSINYRLSMWGFLTGEEVIQSGNANLGFRDQRLALHYAQENIAAFGGDPTKVTIWGESAGALSVGMHLTAYGGRDDKLFRAGIMESGNPIYYSSFDTYSPDTFVNASQQLGCGSASDQLDCLRQIPFATLNAWINSTAGEALTWSPVIDGDFIQGKTSIQLENGDFVHVPIIDGANSDEGTAFGAINITTREDFSTHLTTIADPVILTSDQATKVLDAYPANITHGAVPTNLPLSYIPPAPFGAASRSSDAYYGDVVMIAHRRKTCETWSANGVDAYCYRFNTIPHGLTQSVGVTHFQEVSFVFNNKLGVGYGYPGVSVDPFGDEPQNYFDLSDTMSSAWATFIHDGAPTSFWPSYGGGGSCGTNWVFDANVTGLGYSETDDWRKEGIDLINSWNADVYGR